MEPVASGQKGVQGLHRSRYLQTVTVRKHQMFLFFVSKNKKKRKEKKTRNKESSLPKCDKLLLIRRCGTVQADARSTLVNNNNNNNNNKKEP